MANSYKIAAGSDNEAGFSTLSFPITCPRGIQYPVYRKPMSGTIKPHGSPFCVWEMPNLTDAQLNELFTASGASTAVTTVSTNVTIAIPQLDRTAAFANYNAVMEFRKGEDAVYSDRRWTNVRVRFTELVAT